MNEFLNNIPSVIFIGAGATVILDMWGLVLKALKVPTLNFAYLGRWVGYFPRGQFFHARIAQASPIEGELLLGWLAHYLVGIVFAVALFCLYGATWIQAPSIVAALVFGMATVAIPFFVMQPAMGAGIASSNTPTPLLNCLKSLINHAIFGVGLYLAALVAAHIL